MHALYSQPGQTLRTVGRAFGLSQTGVQNAFSRYGLARRLNCAGLREVPKRQPAPPPPPPKQWCQQCERRVTAAEAQQCSSRWCRAQEMAA